MAKITCVIADDHRMFREGLRAVLEKEGDITVVGEAATGTDAVKRSLARKPDIVIMDISLPDFSGIQAARKILTQDPKIRVVLLSMYADRELVSQAIDHGVYGYLLKESAARELVTAIREVKRGNHFFSAPILKIMVDVHKGMDKGGEKNALTSREREVLRYVADGKSNRQIASILDVSVKTVDNHRQHIMDKLDIHDVIHLTRYAIEHGFVK